MFYKILFIVYCGLSLSFPQISESALQEKGKANQTDWDKLRYDVHTRKLTELYSAESCKERMRFFAKPDNATFGECDCDYSDCSRPLIYSPTTKRCHYGWTQGPCKNGEWYAFDKKLNPVCEKNTCPKPKSKNETGPYYFKRHEDGKCYLVGGDEKPPFCSGEDDILETIVGEPIPVCRGAVSCGGDPFPPSQQCIVGYKYWFDEKLGKCKK